MAGRARGLPQGPTFCFLTPGPQSLPQHAPWSRTHHANSLEEEHSAHRFTRPTQHMPIRQQWQHRPSSRAVLDGRKGRSHAGVHTSWSSHPGRADWIVKCHDRRDHSQYGLAADKPDGREVPAGTMNPTRRSRFGARAPPVSSFELGSEVIKGQTDHGYGERSPKPDRNAT